eukprot:TRINITY_DN72565_c0_g1_i1.p1 TRINITY_DN72565_c0_g1~~TRINITY_DN72565_c0_g1_i1.p1  ORF type:complete len:272 (-),score=59.32 TRINITY_DN72565_c0_g1_i1:87-902(-)
MAAAAVVARRLERRAAAGAAAAASLATSRVAFAAAIPAARRLATAPTRPAALRPPSAGLLAARNLARRGFAVTSEETPNPDSIMFHPGQSHVVLGEGIKTIKFTNKYETADSPLASALFKVRGVAEVMLAARHVTVTKNSNADWQTLQPNVELVIGQFYAAGLRPIREGVAEREVAPDFEPGSLESTIVELLEERVRPFVQQDGGDIEFVRFDAADGTLYVQMHGACSGCPKSDVTLQMGIKNLMEHYIPEVKEIVNVDDDHKDLPRPHDS